MPDVGIGAVSVSQLLLFYFTKLSINLINNLNLRQTLLTFTFLIPPFKRNDIHL